MAKTIGGIARTFGLVWLIVNDLALITLLFLWGNPWWATFFIAITACVIIWEVTAYIFHKKTISTMYKEFIERVGWKGYLCLLLFANAMAGLVLHLAVW